MPHPRITRHFIWLCLAALFAQPAAADWLITLEGRLIETRGPWTIEGGILTYTDAEGFEHSLAVDDVDLEASEETTAVKAGREYVPKERAEPAPFRLTSPSAPAVEPAGGEEPKITLYMTSWCGYCRKARKLLTRLDADFAAKDIEKDPAAAAEFRRKAGGRSGVPVIDFDGKVVRGYNERMIRKLVAKLKEE